jgi:hypothetical protein
LLQGALVGDTIAEAGLSAQLKVPKDPVSEPRVASVPQTTE